MSLEKKTPVFPLSDTPVALTAERIAQARAEAARLRGEAISDAILWVARTIGALFAKRPEAPSHATDGHAAGAR